MDLQSILSSTDENERFITRACQREVIRINALQKANERRSQAITDGIERAIATYAPTLEARGIPSRNWTEELYGYLENKFRAYGLENPPCREVIRRILKKAPYADSL